MDEIAARYRAARAYADLEQKDLAEALGLERQAVIKTEAGKRTPRKMELDRVAHLCNLPPSWFDTGDALSFGPPGSLQRVERLLTEARDALATTSQGEESPGQTLDVQLRGGEDEASSSEAPDQTQNPGQAQRS